MLCCQNIINFISNLIIVKLKQKNVLCQNTKVSKKSIITITEEKVIFELIFESNLLMFDYDIEYQSENQPCGNLSFSLLIDLKKNMFEFSKFKLNYNLNNCNPTPISDNRSADTTSNSNASNTSSIILPASIISAALLGIIPFALGVVGGKKINKFKNKKTKKRKNKNKKNTRKL